MNSRKTLGNDLPKKRNTVNVLLLISLSVAYFASIWALSGKLSSSSKYEFYFGIVGLVILVGLSILGIFGFIKREYSS